MSGLQLIVTDAGRAALVNAQNTGTAPVLVAQVGVTATAFAASASTTALPGEVKRLSTISGQAVADDTIHVTIADDSADVYSMRGFALYLGDGTLFALYGQAGVILEKSAQATLLLSTDVRFVDVAATSLTFGNADFTNPPATTEVQGVVELATAAEAIAGADNTRAMTPAVAKAATDDRFGAGAPTGFVKGLLNVATAALFRMAIGLGDLSTRNGGAGNGADADLLDGQHGAYYLSWANLTGKPATFAPSAHGHGWADISGAPATATRWPDWNEVTGKPGSYTPTAHTHGAGDITSGVFDVARIPDIAQAKVTGLAASLAGKVNLSGDTMAGPLGNRVGSPGTQVIMRTIGWANGVTRWSEVLGATGDYSLWSYNASGANPTMALAVTTPDNGGAYGLYVGPYTAHHTGNFDPSTKASLAGANFTGDVMFPRLFVFDASFGMEKSPATNNLRIRAWDQLEFQSVGGGFVAEVFHRQNFDPSTKATLGANVNFGTITAAGTITAPAFAQSSSRRYKRDIRDLDPRLARELLDAVQWSAYTMRADGSPALGAIAEDLADGPLDFVVRRTMGGVPEAVDYQPLFVLAAALVQSQARQIDDLSARLAAVEARA